jgi:hypothetical protein
MNPILLPLWAGGLLWLFFGRNGRRYRQRGRRQAAEWLAPLKDQVADGGLGHISEIFDGDAPQRPCGCIRAGVERGRGSPGVRGGCKGSAAEVAPETQRSSDKSSQLNRWNTEDCCGDLIDRIGGYCSKGENGISRQLRAIFLVSE